MAERYWVWLDRAGFAVDVSDVPVPDPPDGWRRVEVMPVEDVVELVLQREREWYNAWFAGFDEHADVGLWPAGEYPTRDRARRILGLEDDDG